jgi:hypothetical protein
MKHNSRSQQDLDNITQQNTVADSASSEYQHSPKTTNFPTGSDDHRSYTEHHTAFENPQTQSTSGGNIPTRSQSTRYPPSPSFGETRTDATDDLALNNNSHGSFFDTIEPSQQAPVEQKKSKSRFFDRLSRGKATQEQQPPPSRDSNIGGVGRRLSRRYTEAPSDARNSLHGTEVQTDDTHWPKSQGANSNKSSPQQGRGEDIGLDPYLVQETGHEDPEGYYRGQQHSSGRSPQGHQFQTVLQGQQPTVPDLIHGFGGNEPQTTNQTPQSRIRTQEHLDKIASNPTARFSHASQVSLQAPELNTEYGRQSSPTRSSQPGPSPNRDQELQRPNFPSRASSFQDPEAIMGPPGSSQARRPVDSKQGLQPEGRDTAALHKQKLSGSGQALQQNMNMLPPSTTPVPNSAYRGVPNREQASAPMLEQGRNTPSPADRELSDQFKELCKFALSFFISKPQKPSQLTVSSTKIQKGKDPLF